MDSHYAQIPWNTPYLWREANTSLDRVIEINRDELAEARRLAWELRAHLESIFPTMDNLCMITCPDCTDPCCQRAWVWYDFKDLMFLHLPHIPLPPGQLMGARGERCRYATPTGCRLARLHRPFVCTWYLCPAQIQCLGRERKAVLNETMQTIKTLRRQIEGLFIQKTTQPGESGD